ncbi:MAG TPA: Lsr2 family protein [Pseudonocardia sp.]|uniref:histone-like nucleoid-structuring protein Lsr2 n=1 Tax=Pseudonocardia sp. TaxID=60912 RepID=UPI002F3E9BD7
MAQKVTVSLVDDLSGSRADETVNFGLDGKAYEIDLSAGNADQLRNVLAEFVAAARRPTRAPRSGGGNGSGPRGAAAEREQNQAIRDWAREHGMSVSERGRISAEVIEAYRQDR